MTRSYFTSSYRPRVKDTEVIQVRVEGVAVKGHSAVAPATRKKATSLCPRPALPPAQPGTGSAPAARAAVAEDVL